MSDTQPVSAEPKFSDVAIRPLRETDVAEAERIFRLAFGTQAGLPDPLQFCCDRRFVQTRWKADPRRTWGAHVHGELAGSIIATNWGSLAYFGPLTVRPDFWGRGIAQKLIEPAITQFEKWDTRHACLFTAANSPKHHTLYQKFGFWPRYLTALMTAPVRPNPSTNGWTSLSEASAADHNRLINECRELTDRIYDGLDLSPEIRAVQQLGLGDTVLLWSNDRLAGFAICHCGPDTEAGADQCYIKFAAIRPGPRAQDHFGALLDACEALAGKRGMKEIEAGVNVGRHEAYRQMLARGFRIFMQGVAMHRHNEHGYNRPGVFVLDDWR